jgi:WD40 repeat protein
VAELKPAIYKTEAITAVAFSQRAGSNVIAVGYRDGRLELVEANTGRVRFSGMASGEVMALAFTLYGQGEIIATLTREGTIELWAVDITQSAFTLMGAPLLNPNPNAAFFQLALNHDGTKLATLDSVGAVKIFSTQVAPGETPPFQMQFDFLSETTFAGDLAFSPDGRFLAVVLGTAPVARVLNLETNHEETYTLPDGPQALWVEFTPDGQRIAVGGNPNAYLFDLARQQSLLTFAGNPTWLTALSLSPDGKILATATDNEQSVRLWNAEDGTLLREIQFPDPVHAIDFSADGQRLAVLWYGADGNQLEIWSTNAATAPLANTPTPAPLPTESIISPPLVTEDLGNKVQNVSVVWLPESQATPLPPSGFTFGATITYTSGQETIAHVVAYPLASGEDPAPCELNLSAPEGRPFWANQTNYPPGTQTFSQSFPYNAEVLPNAAYLLVRINVFDTAPVNNLLYCQQRIYPLAQPLETATPAFTPTLIPTFTPCAIGCEGTPTPPPFVTTLPSPTPCQIGCPETTPAPANLPNASATPAATETPIPTPAP